MCGIAGVVGAGRGTADSSLLAMSRALSNRGPDDAGEVVLEDGLVALAHRRLAIIDASSRGHQPFEYAGRVTIVYNGEVYNFRELRCELEDLGYAFHSQSDTEVIAAGYVAWGDDVVTRLRGMFAFALWDGHERRLLVARDRLGIKPLFYCEAAGALYFASEVRAILAAECTERKIDPAALHDFLTIGSCVQPRTLVKGVSALMPGMTLTWRPNELPRMARYWSLPSPATIPTSERPLDYATAVAQLRSLLEEAVRHHLIADVPVGLLLSGGVDSAAVLGLCVQMGARPTCFSLDVRGSRAVPGEMDFARLTAGKWGVRHLILEPDNAEVRSSFEGFLRSLDQPAADGLNTFMISKLASEHVKVVLSGLGADEVFAGYPHVASMRKLMVAAPHGSAMLRWFGNTIARVPPRRFGGFLRRAGADPETRYREIRQVFSEEDLSVGPTDRAGRRAFSRESERYWQQARAADWARAVSYRELTGYLCNTLLRDADNMTMAHGLELRPPLLDHKIVEFGYSLPGEFKVRNGVLKAVFRTATEGLVEPPVSVGRKRGFNLPISEWMQGPLAEDARELLDSASSLLGNHYVERAKTHSQRFALIVLGSFARQHRLTL